MTTPTEQADAVGRAAIEGYGRAAWAAGRSFESCTLPYGRSRIWWQIGWMAAEHGDRKKKGDAT